MQICIVISPRALMVIPRTIESGHVRYHTGLAANVIRVTQDDILQAPAYRAPGLCLDAPVRGPMRERRGWYANCQFDNIVLMWYQHRNSEPSRGGFGTGHTEND